MLYRIQKRKVNQDNFCCLKFQSIYQTQIFKQTNKKFQSVPTKNASMVRKISMKKLNSSSSIKNFAGQSSQCSKFKPINSQATGFQINSAHIQNKKKNNKNLLNNRDSLNHLFDSRLSSINSLRSIRHNSKNIPSRIKITYSNQQEQNKNTISRQINEISVNSQIIQPFNNRYQNLFLFQKLDKSPQIEASNQVQQIPSINIESVKQFTNYIAPYTRNVVPFKKSSSSEITKFKLSSLNIGQQYIEKRQNQEFGEQSEKIKKTPKSYLVIQNSEKKQVAKSGIQSNFNISDAKLLSSLIISDQKPVYNIVKSIVSQLEQVNPDNMTKLIKIPHNQWRNRIRQTYISIANQQSKASIVSADFNKRKSMCTNAAHMLFSPSKFQAIKIK